MDATSLDPRLRQVSADQSATTSTANANSNSNAGHAATSTLRASINASPVHASSKISHTNAAAAGHSELPPLQPNATGSAAGAVQGPGAYSFAPISFDSSHSSPATPGGVQDTPPSAIDGHAATAGGDPTLDPNHPDAKKPRACESCRQLKVRCQPDVDHPDGPCRRCAKAGRACVVTQPTRKRQKKTDSRVAELERKIDMLTASLHGHAAVPGGASGSVSGPARAPFSPGDDVDHASMGFGMVQNLREESGPSLATAGPRPGSGAGAAARSSASSDWASGTHPRDRQASTQGTQVQSSTAGSSDTTHGSKAHAPSMVMAGQKRKFSEGRDRSGSEHVRDSSTPAASAPTPHTLVAFNEYVDVVDRGIISMDLASEFFLRYTDRMSPHLPGVIFPPGTQASEVRRSKPTLFLSIMTAASSEHPSIQRTLNKELMQTIAEKVIITGEKSIEIVQAIQIAVIWYWPPENYEELKFYQLVHIAAVMAIDIGLGRKKQNQGGFKKHIPHSWRDHPFRKRPPPDPTTIEARRAWLTCYFLTVNTSMALHRPTLVRWSPFMTECVDVLESSPEAAPTDRYLCHLVWTHRLAEEVGIQFSIDDPSSATNFSDKQTQYALRGFERTLEKYRNGIAPSEAQPSLKLSFHVLNLYMHEIATQADYLDPLNPPGSGGDDATASSTPGDFDPEVPLNPAHINAISACLTAIDGIFDVFLGIPVADIRCLPVFNFVRVAYAVVILIKMYFAASSPKSELGKVIDKDNMKVEQHLENLLEKFRATAADDKSRPAAKFMVVLAMLRTWFQKQKQGEWPGLAAIPGPVPPAAVASATAPTGSSSSSGTTPTTRPSYPQSIVADSSYQLLRNSTGQPPTTGYSTANTPLQVLSEIAANDSAASLGAVGPITQMQPWSLRPAPPPPPTQQQAAYVYESAADRRSTPSGPGGGGNSGTDTTGTIGTPDTNTSAATGTVAPGVGPLLTQQATVYQQGTMPWLNGNWASDFDYTMLGTDFAQAMDLTLADLTDGGFPSSMENSMRFVMQEPPWFGYSNAMGDGGGGGGGGGGGFF